MIRFQIFSVAHIRCQKNNDVLLVNISLRYIQFNLLNYEEIDTFLTSQICVAFIK